MKWCRDCVPIDLQVGSAADERSAQVFGNIAGADIGVKLEGYNQYRIAIIYQLLHISDPWPIIKKPAHPVGTSLTLQVRGGGELMLIDPLGVSDGRGPEGQCFVGKAPAYGYEKACASRIRIPLTEYHICCDRLTDIQLCDLWSNSPWKCREQTVNCDPFLSEDEGTLMFDSWTLDQTFVPDIDNPRRWRLGCVLKCRQQPGMQGAYPDDCNANPTTIGQPGTPGHYPVGWNHDYKRGLRNGQVMDLGWHFCMVNISSNWTENQASTPHGNCPEPYVPRFPYANFDTIFCNPDSVQVCCPASDAFADCRTNCNDVDFGCSGGSGEDAHLRGSLSGEELQQQVAAIVAESRKANARSIIAANQREDAGEVEIWKPGTPPPLRDIMREQDQKTSELIAELRKTM